MQFALFDVVELVESLPEHALGVGAQGAVVEVFSSPREGYEVEFDDFVIVGLEPHQITLVEKNKASATA